MSENGIRKNRWRIAAVLCSLVPAAAMAASPAQAQAGTTANLTNIATGRCADLPDYGATFNAYVYQYPCDYTSADNQQWETVPTRTINVGPASRDLFLIRNVKSGQCMDLPDTGASPATTPISMHDCVAVGDNQEWYALPGASGGSYYVNQASNLCLDVPGWAQDGTDKTTGDPLTVYPCWHDGWANDGTDDHLWRLKSA